MLASLLLLLLLLAAAEVSHGQSSSPKYSRDDFPPAPSFVFGAGTSAYQVEGAAAEDGRTPSIWDTFTHAGNMKDNSTGDVAADEYHKYREDVKLMRDIGLEAYRLSISWSRLLPNGRGAINPKGLKYYNNLINELVKYGIQPHVSLFQQDLPQVLENEYEGWLSPKIVEFGDRVLHWTTLVQPNIIGLASYDTGTYPPQHCSYPFGIHCTKGNSTMEPYVAVHHMLLAHAATANLYRTKYQDALKKIPPLRPLCLILKIFLQQRELNEVYSGGVGSYALIVMLIAYMKIHWSQQHFWHSEQPMELNLGILLANVLLLDTVIFPSFIDLLWLHNTCIW